MVLCRRKKSQEQALFDIFQSLKIEQYKKTVLQERYLVVLQNFHSRAKKLEVAFYLCRVIMTVGSILVPAFLSIQGATFQTQIYWVTWILSLSVTISNGFMTLFKLDKKYFFINTTLEMLHSEGWQYAGLSGRYAPKDAVIPPTHENQFLIFFHMAEKIKMRQVEEEFWKFTDPSDIGNATNPKGAFVSQTPNVQQGPITTLPIEQKSVIDNWVGDMNSDILGLQPRTRNMLGKVDGRKGTSGNPGATATGNTSIRKPTSPGIPESSVETDVSVREELPNGTLIGSTVVQSPSPNSEQPEIPENTVIKVLFEEPIVWSGTETKPNVLEQKPEFKGQS